MELTFKGVDISTEEKFVSYINSLNTAIMKQNAMNEIKQDWAAYGRGREKRYRCAGYGSNYYGREGETGTWITS